VTVRADVKQESRSGSRRPLRRDAERNRQRLLAAASQVFADHGPEAGVEEIARAAGVGTGTLYRRFPTKDALVSALIDDALDEMIALAEAATGDPDGTGLERFLEAASACQAAHRGALARLWHAGGDVDRTERLRRAIARLLADAKRHGRVREELAETDLTMLLWSMRGVIVTTGHAAPDAWRRHLGILLAGLRPAEPRLPRRPLRRAEFRRIITDG
jgi:AcrR family transcriptional regulator